MRTAHSHLVIDLPLAKRTMAESCEGLIYVGYVMEKVRVMEMLCGC